MVICFRMIPIYKKSLFAITMIATATTVASAVTQPDSCGWCVVAGFTWSEEGQVCTADKSGSITTYKGCLDKKQYPPKHLYNSVFDDKSGLTLDSKTTIFIDSFHDP